MGLFKNSYRFKLIVFIALFFDQTTASAQLYINSSQFFINSTSTLFVKQQDVIGNYSIIGNGTIHVYGTALQNIDMNGNTIPNLKVDNAINANVASICQTANIILQPSALLTVNNQLLKVNGSITNNSGSMDLTNGSMELNGNLAQSISGSTFKNKTIKSLKLSNSSGVSLSGVNDSLKIAGVLNFGASNVTFTTNNNLTISSTASNTACIADMTSNGSYNGNKIQGNVTVERYIPNHKKAWQLLAVPTLGQTIRQAWQENASAPNENLKPGYGTQITSNLSGAIGLGFDAYTAGGPSIKTYNSINSSWDGVSSTNNTIANSKGYMIFVRGDRSITGITTDTTLTILRTTGALYQPIGNAPGTINVLNGKFECVSNPYASAIDFSKTNKTGGLQDLFYVWDPKLTTGPNSANGYGGYQTFTSNGNGTYHITPAGGSFLSNDIAGNIQSGSAFFVSASGSDGTLEFAENNKVENSALVTRAPNGMPERLEIKLSAVDVSTAILLDGVMLDFDSAYSNNIDAMDAIKLYSSAENIAIKNQSKTLVVERRKELKSGDTLFLFLNRLKLKNYKFDFHPSYINTGGLTAFLVDQYLQSKTLLDLIIASAFQFPVNSDPQSYASDRFFITFKTAQTLPVKIISIDAKRNEDKTATIKWKTENEINLNHYEIERADDGLSFITLGSQQPLSNNDLSYEYSFNDINAKTSVNYYRVKAISNDGQIQYSKIVKLDALNTENTIFVYPNPVKDNFINIQFENNLTGLYSIMLSDIAGKNIFNKNYNISVNKGSIKVVLPKNTFSGNYLLKIIQPNGDISTQLILITTK
jgi:hypothetical protein